MKKSVKKKLNFMIPKIYGINHIHFVGIGGVSMSGIAKLLFKMGYKISGSDLNINDNLKKLSELGINIYFKHHKENIIGADVIVISSAISQKNIEVILAKKMNIPVINRCQMLAEIVRFKNNIIITGTHGKTTTTAMISSIYVEGKIDPTVLYGGFLKKNNENIRIGNSPYFITEADESNHSFLHLSPIKLILTNIDSDHLDEYNGSIYNLKNIFLKFIKKIPFYGRCIICIDDPEIRKLIPNLSFHPITYGFSIDADIKIINYHQKKNKSYFSILREKKPNLDIQLNVPGYQNALNAAAAIAATEEIKDETIIKKALKNFLGIKRRFDFLGKFSLKKINGKNGKVLFFEDYGHHPTEIKNTINTVKNGWPEKKIIMIFQPHRYTRTYNLYNKFIKTLLEVDILLLLKIDSAGEKPISNINSKNLCYDIKKKKNMHSIFIKNEKNLLKILVNFLSKNTIVLIQGAGNINYIALNLIKKIKKKYRL